MKVNSQKLRRIFKRAGALFLATFMLICTFTDTAMAAYNK